MAVYFDKKSLKIPKGVIISHISKQDWPHSASMTKLKFNYTSVSMHALSEYKKIFAYLLYFPRSLQEISSTEISQTLMFIYQG